VVFAAKLITWERSRLSVRLLGCWEGYVRTEGLGITDVSLDKGTQEENAGMVQMEEPVLEFILFPVDWWENGAGAD